jgi:hypothetical protein
MTDALRPTSEISPRASRFPYRIDTFPSAAVPSRSDSISSILRGDLDGFVVSDFLSAGECAGLIKGFRALQDRERVRADVGIHSYPMAFAQMDQMVREQKMTAREYHERARTFREGFASRFGVDLERRLGALFEGLASGIKTAVPEDLAGCGSFVPFTFRELLPGVGTLKAHCERLFFQEFPSFFERLMHFTDNEALLSFFIVLQRPGRGGALALYDLIWRPGQKRPTDFDIRHPDGACVNVDDVEALPQQRLSPSTGALVVFSGGKIWHRVDLTETAPSRITIGGFLSFSPDVRRMYLWS